MYHSTTSRRPAASRRFAFKRFFVLVVQIVAILIGVTAAPAADPKSNALRKTDPLVLRLLQPHSGLVDGTELRKAIQMVAASGEDSSVPLNAWLDRKVDPGTPVSPGALGPTRYASLVKIARQANCVCYPVGNCVLIGRPTWVSMMLEKQFLERAETSSRESYSETMDVVDVRWPRLSTPMDARRAVLAAASKNGPLPPDRFEEVLLPHDLWPEAHLHRIHPDLAIQLIDGQFLDPNLSRASAGKFRFTRSYQFADVIEIVKRSANNPSVQARRVGKLVQVSAPAENHIQLCETLLTRVANTAQSMAGASQSGLDSKGDAALRTLRNDSRTFTLTVQNQPARKVLKALASQLNLECEFSPDANPQFDQRVSFEAVDQTLWELVRLIATQASLKIGARNGKLQFVADEPR